MLALSWVFLSKSQGKKHSVHLRVLSNLSAQSMSMFRFFCFTCERDEAQPPPRVDPERVASLPRRRKADDSDRLRC